MLRFRQLLNEEFQGKDIPSAQRIAASVQRLIEDMVHAGCPGIRGARTLSAAYDLLIQKAFSHYHESGSQPLAVIATGGYGRRELSPGSDIDLLFLTDGEPQEDEPAVSSLLGLLWDVAEEAGHKTMGLSAIDEVMNSHIATATSFLDTRLICGDEALFAEMTRRAAAYFRANCDTFIATKIEETGVRHARQGGTVFRQQPDIKEAPGGLRDIQTIRWVGKALEHAGRGKALSPHPLISAEDIEAMEESLDFLLSVRLALHKLAGKKEDILRIDLHSRVAEILGFEDSAETSAAQDQNAALREMMRTYYRHAAAANRALRLVMTSMMRVESSERRRRVEQRRRLAGQSFAVVGKALFAGSASVFEGAGGGMEIVGAFELAQKHRANISDELVKRIHDNLYRVDDNLRNNAKSAEAFMGILAGVGNVAPAARAMRDSGFLSAYLPAFGNIEGLITNDPIHEYTVDEHTLFALAAVDSLLAAADGLDLLKRQVLEALPHPEILMLAILTHDIGKSKGGSHPERGALIVPQITEQLRLPENLARQVVFLVSNHLLLETIVRTRDTNDEKILTEVAEIAGSVEMLDYLYLLSYADVSSVGLGAWPSWQDALLHELYQKARILIAEGAVPAPRDTDFREALLESLPGDISREEALLHVELVPRRYRLEVSVDEAIEHLMLIKKLSLESAAAAITYKVKDNMSEIWVVSPDRPGRVAEIAGSISASGLAIQSAVAYTRRDEIILDKFTATLPKGSLLASPWETVRKNIVSVLAGEVSVEALMSRHVSARKQKPTLPLPQEREDTTVIIDNRISDSYTVVDVICSDRLGLLYDLTRAILMNGMDIHFARIATHASMATDVFYITRSGSGKLTDEAAMQKLRAEITEAIKGKKP